jgi:hypothetical protein
MVILHQSEFATITLCEYTSKLMNFRLNASMIVLLLTYNALKIITNQAVILAHQVNLR